MKFNWIVSAGLLPFVVGQVVYKEPVLRRQYADLIDSSKYLKWNYATFALPPYIDNDRLAFEEERTRYAENPDLSSGYYQFGKAFEVDLDLKDGTWIDLPDGAKLWRMAICKFYETSLYLRHQFRIPMGCEFYVRQAEDLPFEDETMGPFTYLNNKDHMMFSTFPVAGNKIVLEYYAPKSVTQLPLVRISHVIHGYREVSSVRGRSGDCNINVNCVEGELWENEIRSVVMMLTRFGQGFCSGSMLNNGRKDGRQLYLTAYHCVQSSNSAQDMLLFNHQYSRCDSRSPPATPVRQTAQGLNALARFEGSDFALFELEEKIPVEYNAYLAGWSAESQAPAVPVGIHHPSADMKKISFSFLNCTEDCWFGSCGRRAADHWRVQKWSKGTTEPGSSGSPLFDGLTHRVVGQLHGGSASCYNRDGYDVYGKIAHSFDKAPEGERLKDYLDPEDSGLYAMDGMDLNDLHKAKALFVQG